MKKSLDKYVKKICLLICIIIVTILLYCIGSILLFFNMYIEHIYVKYEIKIPMGSFDAKYGGGERYLYNEEVSIDTIYYTKEVDYLIKKYNFENIDSESKEFKDLSGKIINELNTENKEKVKEYLSKNFQDAYYKFIENENGKLLLIYFKSEQTILCIENKLDKVN